MRVGSAGLGISLLESGCASCEGHLSDLSVVLSNFGDSAYTAVPFSRFARGLSDVVLGIYRDFLWQHLYDAAQNAISEEGEEKGPEERLKKAFDLMWDVHSKAQRQNGEPYVIHPVSVAVYMAQELSADLDTIIAALLHDVIEDSGGAVSEEYIRKEFGEQVARMVMGVTRLTKADGKAGDAVSASTKISRYKAVRKLLIYMLEDPRTAILKLCDRLHNMRTIEFMAKPRDGQSLEEALDKQRRIARETLDVYVPLAQRLGIYKLKEELEDRAFRILYPEEYWEIRQKLLANISQRIKTVKSVVKLLRSALNKELPSWVRYQIYWRVKSIPSIYRKISAGRSLEEIYDLIGLRVILDGPEDKEDELSNFCYTVLGVVHKHFRSVPNRFKDFISNPKPNGYRSIHTTVVDPNGKYLEIQIRTMQMHMEAELGLAAHWVYKEKICPRRDEIEFVNNLRKRLGEMFRFWEDSSRDDAVRQQLISGEEILVFTPKGHPMVLPRGATPVDFAYHIHTQVGHRCVAAKVNGKMVPLSRKLEDGDQVEIILSPDPNKGPSRDWLTFVKTNRARSKIRQWFRKRQREQEAREGKQLLERFLPRVGIGIKELENALSGRDLENLYVDVLRARKRLLTTRRWKKPSGSFYKELERVVLSVVADRVPEFALRVREYLDAKARAILEEKSVKPAVTVSGGDFAVYRATCCYPLPPERIVGVVRTGKGIIAHRSKCSTLHRLQETIHPDRFVELSWVDLEHLRDSFGGYPTRLLLRVVDRVGLLHDITRVLLNEEKSIQYIKTWRNRGKKGELLLELEVSLADLGEYRRILRALLSVEGVMSVRRGKKT